MHGAVRCWGFVTRGYFPSVLHKSTLILVEIGMRRLECRELVEVKVSTGYKQNGFAQYCLRL
jgi:hypothetical protein